jgi:uncharacterized membrane protein
VHCRFLNSLLISVGVLAAERIQAQVSFQLLPHNGPVQAWALSADGSTLVGSGNLTPGIVEAWRWSGQSFIQPLGLTDHAALGVSYDGSVIVGRGWNGGWRWSTSTGGTPIPLSHPRTVTWDGSVVAGRHWATAAIWTASAGIELIGDLPGAWSTEVLSISATGTVVGEAYLLELGRYQAFIGSAGSGVSQLELLSGHDASRARVISQDSRIIAGVSAATGVPYSTRAIRWVEGVPHDLGVLPGTMTSTATGMNHDGSLITGLSGSVPFIWTEATGMVSLADILTSNGINLQGVTFNTVHVSADGSTFGGHGAFAQNARPWIATIPAPASVLLIAALPIMSRRRPR